MCKKRESQWRSVKISSVIFSIFRKALYMIVEGNVLEGELTNDL